MFVMAASVCGGNTECGTGSVKKFAWVSMLGISLPVHPTHWLSSGNPEKVIRVLACVRSFFITLLLVLH